MHIVFSLWKPALEICMLAFFFYYLLLFIKGTPVISVLKVLVILFIGFFIVQKLELHTINWVLTKLFAFLVIALLIIFQPELRRALVYLSGGPFLFFTGIGKKEVIDEITTAIGALAKRKIGAIIAFEREIGLKSYIETGITLNSVISKELITTIFTPATILHDGGVIIQGDIVAAAGCIFPLSQNPNLDREMGTRHQAGLGLAEETDAMVLIVSEETGTISLAYRSKLSRDLDEKGVKKVLTNLYIKQPKKKLFRH